MEQISIFQLINMKEKIGNANIIAFSQRFSHPLGISPIIVLSELKNKGPRKQVELAYAAGLTKGAMTNIANKLVQLHFATRLYDQADRRTVRLEITEKGLEALAEAQQIGLDIHTDLFSSFSEQELQEYFRLEKKLMDHIQQQESK